MSMTKKCDRCDHLVPKYTVEDAYGEFVCDSCDQNEAEAAYERYCEAFHDGADRSEENEMNARAKHHMTYLAAGAEMASRHARALPFRPPFPTAAVDELRDAEQALEDALQKVREAMLEYDRKPLETI
jgi:Histidine kinase